jgi:hypothetical protein
VTAVAIGLEVELDDLYILFDSFPAVRLRVAFIETHQHFSEKLVIGAFPALGGIQAQIGTQRDAFMALE